MSEQIDSLELRCFLRSPDIHQNIGGCSANSRVWVIQMFGDFFFNVITVAETTPLKGFQTGGPMRIIWIVEHCDYCLSPWVSNRCERLKRIAGRCRHGMLRVQNNIRKLRNRWRRICAKNFEG